MRQARPFSKEQYHIRKMHGRSLNESPVEWSFYQYEDELHFHPIHYIRQLGPINWKVPRPDYKIRNAEFYLWWQFIVGISEWILEQFALIIPLRNERQWLSIDVLKVLRHIYVWTVHFCTVLSWLAMAILHIERFHLRQFFVLVDGWIFCRKHLYKLLLGSMFQIYVVSPISDQRLWCPRSFQQYHYLNQRVEF